METAIISSIILVTPLLIAFIGIMIFKAKKAHTTIARIKYDPSGIYIYTVSAIRDCSVVCQRKVEIVLTTVKEKVLKKVTIVFSIKIP